MGIENVKKISDGIYLVRTQAGFKQAIKMEFGDWVHEWQKMEVSGFPVDYPSVVSLSLGYKGSHYVVCNSIHVNTLLAAIKDA